MPKKLTILVSACNEAGHLNAVTGETLELKRRGHRVVFILPETWRGKLARHGFEEHVYQTEKPASANEHPGEHNAKILFEYKMLGNYTPLEKMQELVKIFDSEHHLSEIRENDKAVKVALKKYQPDVIIVDAHSLSPAIYTSGIPWIKSCSMNPLFEVWDSDLPPGGSGLSQNSDRSKWTEFVSLRKKIFASPVFSNLLKEMGYEPYANDIKFPPTEILTVYACPEELNYPQIRQNGWHNLEAFNKVDASGTVARLEDILPKEFMENNLNGTFSGKYIYFSLGSMASVDVNLMRRMTGVLSKTPHKYIVSKGPRHDQFELPANMWGDQYLPQTKIIPIVDLVITHGGNNTVTETFATGTPMVAMPMFADQFDNAQRLVETGLGVRVMPYDFEDSELIAAVEKALGDEEIKRRLQVAAKRIQSEKRHEQLADKIEQLLAK
ncbi:PREDICTED: uncharacterized UDP-glucosyltransferase YjiC-like [Rhagoletis zephyria]|uniref:uncharacterized UDP-glucosyltransferase YjiC-like n=1 Tax=Rhagoletis zephyria TaxID=28612 RepID=UPI0008113979|nr:PREDICTED: uncharacterized UDP-glucosyltransferase YjiC-like [Rhagoletis zephyria]